MSGHDVFAHRRVIQLPQGASKASEALADDWDDNGCSVCSKLPDGPDHVVICGPLEGWRGAVICQQCAAAAKAALRDRAGSSSAERPPELEHWRKGPPPADGNLYVVEVAGGSMGLVLSNVPGGLLYSYRTHGAGGSYYIAAGAVLQHIRIPTPWEAL